MATPGRRSGAQWVTSHFGWSKMFDKEVNLLKSNIDGDFIGILNMSMSLLLAKSQN